MRIEPSHHRSKAHIVDAVVGVVHGSRVALFAGALVALAIVASPTAANDATLIVADATLASAPITHTDHAVASVVAVGAVAEAEIKSDGGAHPLDASAPRAITSTRTAALNGSSTSRPTAANHAPMLSDTRLWRTRALPAQAPPTHI